MNTVDYSARSARAADHRHEKWLGRLRARWMRVLSSTRYDRLEGSLRIARAEIGRRLDTAAPSSSATPGWKKAAVDLLTEAEDALNRGKMDQSWKLLHAARRMEVYGIENKEELTAVTATLRAEAEKLKSWRQSAVLAIVGTRDKPVVCGASAVAEAVLVRDDHFNNQGYKDRLIRTQILLLALTLAGVMAAILGLAYAGRLPLDQTLPRTFASLMAVMLFGTLGGTISAMLRASDTTLSARIPEITSTSRVTFMRILMGGASAVVVHFALQSQLTGIFNQQLAAAVAVLTPPTAYIVAFASGFSERLVLRAVEYIAGKQAAESDSAKASAKT